MHVYCTIFHPFLPPVTWNEANPSIGLFDHVELSPAKIFLENSQIKKKKNFKRLGILW